VDQQSLPNTPNPGADAGLAFGSSVRREWAAGMNSLMCPKRALLPNQQICILGEAGWSDQEYIGRTSATQGQYCALLGPSGNWSHSGGLGGPAGQRLVVTTGRNTVSGDVRVGTAELPAQICFARIGCGDSSRVRRNSCLPQANNATDPGDLNSGRRFANTVSDTTSTIRVSSQINPSYALQVPVNATASIDTSNPARALLTDLNISQRSPQTWEGHTVTDALGRIEDVWIAPFDAASGKFLVVPSTANFLARASIDGTSLWNVYLASASPQASITFSGDTATIDARIADDANKLNIEVHLTLNATTVRPYARIEPVTPVDVECTGADNESVTLHGLSTTPTGAPFTPAERTQWRYRFGIISNTDTVTLSVPNEGPESPGYPAHFASISGMFSMEDTVNLRVVDTTPPAVVSTQLQMQCGWGLSSIEPNVQIPVAQGAVTGSFFEQCTTVSTVAVVRTAVYSYPSNVLLREQSFADDSPHALTPLAGALDDNLSNVDYVIEYKIRDQWGNWSPVRQWRGWFYRGGASSGCNGPAVPVTLSDANL
jgi:hypothetical protein